jgi:cell fate (sporulation/competence/biofilm development) regulator YlbF (YheA/YmcA/DUF963 family)
MVATLSASPTIEDKALELCQFVLEQPEFQDSWNRIEAFLADPAAQGVYRAWQEASRDLAMREREGIPLTDHDLVAVEVRKEAVLENAVALGFAESEEILNGIFGTVTRLLQKTLQLGRVPTEEDLSEGSCCGGGCGCK